MACREMVCTSFTWKETGGRFQSSSVPSNNCLDFVRSESSDSLSHGVRCLQLSLTIQGRSALSYFESRISTTRLVACVLAGSWARHVFFECLGDARLELQIIDVPHGQEYLIYGDCVFLNNPT
jgi:hypothetical protein